MTIPLNNWCDVCQEACHDHATICTVCGSALQAPPPPQRSSNTSNTPSARPLPPELTAELQQANQELSTMLASLRTQMVSIRAMANEAIDTNAAMFQQGDNNNNDWQNVPAEAMDPQASRPKSRPTAKATLEQIPRIVLESKSALLHQAVIEISQDSSRHFVALLGEFGPAPPHLFRDAVLVVSQPKTAKGGLSPETKTALRRPDRARTILYVERGDGVTFVKKALMAQEAGASAVIIGNNTALSWPYIMKDSKGEAVELTIPVVMVKQSDGHKIVALCQQDCDTTCLLEVSANTTDCVVCRDNFESGQKVMRLPSCGHVFHEACALSWLNHHNTCPYCRWELPTDDAEYEQERRRIQRTHAGSQVTNNGNWQDFYG